MEKSTLFYCNIKIMLYLCKYMKEKAVKKPRIVKTRNSGTMGESSFWSFIRSALRQKSRWWKPIQECRKNARRAYTGANKRLKWEYQCSECKLWFPDKNIEVDHIKPVGSLKSASDLADFVENLFCEVDNLRVLCKPCHVERHKK